MSTFRDKVDHFLFHFSYSIKIKSIILLAASTAIFIAIMLVISQHRLLSSANVQESGIEYQQELNALLGNVLLHQIFTHNQITVSEAQGVSLESLQAAVDENLRKLNILNEKTASQILSQNTQEELLIYYKAVIKGWNEILETEETNLVYFKMIQDLRKLSEVVNNSFELLLNIDTGMHYLLKSFNQRLPAIEVLTAQLIISPEITLPAEEVPLPELATLINQKEDLLQLFTDLERDINFAQQENSAIDDFLSAPMMLSVLKKFHYSYENLLLIINSSEKVPSPEQLAQAGALGLISSNKLGQQLSSKAVTLLQKQSNTLLIREYYGLGFIIFGMVVMLAAYTTRIIRRPVAGIRDAAEELSKGKVGVRIEIFANDEVGQICESFNQLVERIEIIIHDADAISSNLATSSKGIFTTAKQLESNVIRQEQAITQIASNAKGVSRTVQDFAKSLLEVNQSATLTAHLASLGQTSLNEMENIMHQMAKASMSIVKTLSDLQDKIGRINNVINTIVRIADQINLLSLNTAIRAGKPGIENLGFSVVADKISELADQTALATLDIEELVEKIIKMVSDSVSIVDNFSDQIRTQVFESSEIGAELKKLINNTQQQFEAFEAVNESMQEQTSRAQQIHESISLLNVAAQNTTQSVRNLYLEIEYLHHSTNNLKVMTKKLTEESYEELTPQTT